MYPVNLIPESYPEKRTRLTLASKRISQNIPHETLTKRGIVG